MTLSIKDLQSVMAPLTDLGRGEATFEVGGLPITIRTLSPEEEIATQRHARGALAEGDANDQINALDYLDRFRTACLGYAIVQIGDMDFRGVTTVETGEKLPNGVAVKIKKHEAISKVMESWSRQMVTTLFQRFTSLMEKVEAGIEKTLKYDDDHIDAEIARLEEKLVELKATKSKRDAGTNDPRSELRDAASGRNSAEKPSEKDSKEGRETWETASLNRKTEESPLKLELPSDIPRTLLVEEEVRDTPETEVSSKEQPNPAEVSPRKPVFGDRPKPREAPAPVDPLKNVESSLVDTSDPDVIEAENRRLMVERAKRIAPPHLAAREVAKAIEQAGSIEGVPVFKMPMQDLTPSETSPQTRKAPAPSNVNPRFRPAK